ncbi:hypothetical protein H311_01286 [Anncaliia algerae PRA109]|nr:hypothetical protein H311_01286 [Anncaliia algerae PRA109]
MENFVLQEGKKLIGFGAALKILISNIFGIGVIKMPQSYLRSGLLGFICMLTMSSVLTFISSFVLCISAKRRDKENSLGKASEVHVNHTTYGTLFEILSKRVGKNIANAIIAFMCYLTTLVFFLFIVEFIEKFLYSILLTKNKEISEYFLKFILSSGISILLFTMVANIKTMDKLAKLCYATIIGISCLTLVLIIFSFFLGNPLSSLTLFGEGKLVLSLPEIIFATFCQTGVIPIYEDLADKSKKNITKVIASGVFVSFIVYFIIGLCGYIIAGNLLEGDILSTLLNKSSPVYDSIRGGTVDIFFGITSSVALIFIVGLCASFTCQTLIAMRTFNELLTGNQETTKIRRYLTICLQFLILIICGSFGVNVGRVIQIIASVFMTLLAYIFPSAINIVQNKKKITFKKLILPLILLIFGAFIICYVPYNIIKEIFSDPQNATIAISGYNSTNLTEGSITTALNI